MVPAHTQAQQRPVTLDPHDVSDVGGVGDSVSGVIESEVADESVVSSVLDGSEMEVPESPAAATQMGHVTVRDATPADASESIDDYESASRSFRGISGGDAQRRASLNISNPILTRTLTPPPPPRAPQYPIPRSLFPSHSQSQSQGGLRGPPHQQPAPAAVTTYDESEYSDAFEKGCTETFENLDETASRLLCGAVPIQAAEPAASRVSR